LNGAAPSSTKSERLSRWTLDRTLDIAEYTDANHSPMIPHTIVLEPNLGFFARSTVEELRLDLRAVTRKCRPDKDITTPEMKAA